MRHGRSNNSSAEEASFRVTGQTATGSLRINRVGNHGRSPLESSTPRPLRQGFRQLPSRRGRLDCQVGENPGGRSGTVIVLRDPVAIVLAILLGIGLGIGLGMDIG
jgi:hypothetical protein